MHDNAVVEYRTYAVGWDIFSELTALSQIHPLEYGGPYLGTQV